MDPILFFLLVLIIVGVPLIISYRKSGQLKSKKTKTCVGPNGFEHTVSEEYREPTPDVPPKLIDKVESPAELIEKPEKSRLEPAEQFGQAMAVLAKFSASDRDSLIAAILSLIKPEFNFVAFDEKDKVSFSKGMEIFNQLEQKDRDSIFASLYYIHSGNNVSYISNIRIKVSDGSFKLNYQLVT